jgi:hypothetical protein
MKLRFKVLRSWYFLSADYELIGEECEYNYGIAFPEEIGLPDGSTLESILDKVQQEELELPDGIEHEEDEYYEREYDGETEIDDISQLTLFWIPTSEGERMYIYDCVKYKDKIIHLYLDE